jgi:hypothetical protein
MRIIMAADSKPEGARARKPLTQDRLKELLHYDPETGIWMRIVSRNGDRNNARAGIRAGCLKKHGYRTIDVDGVRYYEHRLSAFYMTGKWPEKYIDHRNNTHDENIFRNLRQATPGQNCANRHINKTSTTGFKGVVRHCDPKRKKRFGARIKINRKSRHLGWFSLPEEAHAAYCRAALEVHGEFARFG